MTLSNSILAPGWEWRGASKVKKGRKHYIRISGDGFKYVGPTERRGDHHVRCVGGFPYLKLAALTYCEEDLRKMIDAKHREQRRNIG